MEQPQPFTRLTITDIRAVGKDVKLFFLRSENGAVLPYKAGQYLTFVLPAQEPEVRRSYSLASAPVLGEPLCIGVKRIENGAFSRKLVDGARVGDELVTIGAGGLFVLPDEIDRWKQIFFFAAGSGIIPVYSLLKTALHAFPHLSLVLVYSNSSEESTLFYEELRQLEAESGNRLRTEFLFSNSKNLLGARLHADLIEQFLKRHGTGNYNEALYYICGPEAYMRLCTFTLRRLHVAPQNLKKEIFHTARSVHRIEPPDKAPHTVTILHHGREHTVEVQYPHTILQAGRKAGLNLPYSCEAGRCGNCIAACMEGKIWMANNEVLTDAETEKGLVLTCTAYPVDGNAVIRV